MIEINQPSWLAILPIYATGQPTGWPFCLRRPRLEIVFGWLLRVTTRPLIMVLCGVVATRRINKKKPSGVTDGNGKKAETCVFGRR